MTETGFTDLGFSVLKRSTSPGFFHPPEAEQAALA